MEDLDVQIKKLNEATQQMLRRYKQLQKENEGLKTQIENLNQQLLAKDDLIFSNEQKTTAENVAVLYDEDEKKYLQQKIDVYLKDIEKCLSLLNA